MICVECGNDFELHRVTRYDRIKHNLQIDLCKSCMKILRDKHAAESNSRNWKNFDKQYVKSRMNKLNAGRLKWHQNLSDEARIENNRKKSIGHKLANTLRSQEEKLILSKKRASHYNSKSDDEKKVFAIKMGNFSREYWKNISDDKYICHCSRISKYRNDLSTEKKYDLIFNALKHANHSNSERDFIDKFNEFNIDNRYILKSNKDKEYIDGISHVWDFRIYDKNGELLILVDIDGYYHFDPFWKYESIKNAQKFIKDTQRDLNRLLQSNSLGIRFHIIQCSNNNKLIDDQYNELTIRLEQIHLYDHSKYHNLLIAEYAQYLENAKKLLTAYERN